MSVDFRERIIILRDFIYTFRVRLFMTEIQFLRSHMLNDGDLHDLLFRHNRKILRSLPAVQVSNPYRRYRDHDSLRILDDLVSTLQDFYTASSPTSTAFALQFFNHPGIDKIFRISSILGQVSTTEFLSRDLLYS